MKLFIVASFIVATMAIEGDVPCIAKPNDGDLLEIFKTVESNDNGTLSLDELMAATNALMEEVPKNAITGAVRRVIIKEAKDLLTSHNGEIGEKVAKNGLFKALKFINRSNSCPQTWGKVDVAALAVTHWNM